jgi:hypothetical protein
MDDIVKQAMAKWPNVPHVYGWLSLDRRGVWRIKGDAVTNEVIAGFISRNYAHDDPGRWFFQNGPQRVFVALDYTPFVYRIAWNADPRAALKIGAHTGAAVEHIESAWIDETGVVLLVTEHGVGMLDDRNLELLLACLTDGAGNPLDEETITLHMEILQNGNSADLCLNHAGRRLAFHAIASADVAAKFGFIPKPLQPAGEEPCN